MPSEELIEKVARALCENEGRDPDYLEPGDDPYMNNTTCIDGYNRKGEPCHFFWRHYDRDARAAIAIVLNDVLTLLRHEAGEGRCSLQEAADTIEGWK